MASSPHSQQPQPTEQTMNHSIEHIISRPDTWRGFEGAPQQHLSLASRPANSEWHGTDSLPTGFSDLDRALQFGGWPNRGAIEVLSDSCGMGAMGLFLPTMATLSDQERWQTFIAPPYTPYSPLLDARGIETRQVLMVHPKDREELLWATEQALRSTTCSIVFSWLGATEYRYAELRKLQLAAAENDTLAVLFRATDARNQHSPASLRLLMSGYRQVEILKQRGGRHGLKVALPSEDDLPNQPQLWELPGDPTVFDNDLQVAPAV
jgi:cell division inhibitor SulA